MTPPKAASMRWLHQLGLPGMIGLALLLAAAWGWQVELPPLRDELARTQDRADDVRSRLKAASEHAASTQSGAPDGLRSVPPTDDPQEAWRLWWSRLPAADQATPLQAQVLAQATRLGLTVSSVQYRGAPLPALPQVWRQQLTLPVEGEAPAVRAWLAALLAEPAISVDSLDIGRDDAMAPRLKGRVAVSIWWRRTP